jgi:hypothetical protein
MSTRTPLVLFAVGAFAVAGCDKLGATDGSSSAPSQPVTNTNATVDTDPIAQAENAASVKQYAEELKLAPRATALATESTPVRSRPQSRDKVAVLANGIGVTELAKEYDYYLVLFSDPQDANKKLAGWVYKDAIENYAGKAIAPAPGLSCKEGEAHVLTDREFCATSCKDDDDCAEIGGVCDGSGKMASAMHALSEGHYCIVGAEGK